MPQPDQPERKKKPDKNPEMPAGDIDQQPDQPPLEFPAQNPPAEPQPPKASAPRATA